LSFVKFVSFDRIKVKDNSFIISSILNCLTCSALCRMKENLYESRCSTSICTDYVALIRKLEDMNDFEGKSVFRCRMKHRIAWVGGRVACDVPPCGLRKKFRTMRRPVAWFMKKILLVATSCRMVNERCRPATGPLADGRTEMT
jgi:hypothetical protein